MSNDFNNGGIFFFDSIDTSNIEKLRSSGGIDTIDKKVELVAYLVELAFDLMICPRDNISSSPGFELIFGAVV